MKISIIIPCYNAHKTIGKTIDSILVQKIPIYEIIVIDDCSTDQSIQYIKKNYNHVTLVKNETNRGAAYTRNRGIEEAKGEVLIFIDSDLVVKKGTVSALLEKANKSDIVFPKIIYENGNSM